MRAFIFQTGKAGCLAILALLPLYAVATPAPHVAKVTEKENGQSVALRPGDTLCVTLHDYGDSGDSWYVLWNPDDPLVSPPVLTHMHGKSKPGDFGTDTFRFTVPRTADKTFSEAEWLRFVALRPWEPDMSKGMTIQYHITVAASHNPARR